MGSEPRSTYNKVNSDELLEGGLKMKIAIEIIIAVLEVLMDGKQVANQLNEGEIYHSVN